MQELIWGTSANMLSMHALLIGSVAGCLWLIAIIVLWRDRFSTVSWCFFALAGTVAWWLSSFFGMYVSTTASQALIWAKVAYAIVPFIPACAYLFAVSVLKEVARKKKWVRWAFATSAVFSFSALLSNDFLQGVKLYWWGYYPQYGWVGIPYLFYFFGAIFASLWLYLSAYKRIKSNSSFRNQVGRLLLAFSIGYLAFVDYFAKFGWEVYPFGFLPVLGFITLTAWTVARQRLVDITPTFAVNEILNTMSEGLVALDKEGVVRLVNRAFMNIFQKKENELVGTEVWALTPPLFTYPQWHAIIQIAQSVNYYEIVIPNSGKNTGPRTYGLFGTFIKPKPREVVGMICLLTDITERKAVEQKLRESQQELEKRVKQRTVELSQVVEDLKTFTYSISHDLGTQLTLISGYARLLQETQSSKLNEEGKHDLEVIFKHVRKIQSLLESILAYSRSTYKEMKKAHIDMNQLFQEEFEDVQSVYSSRKIQFTLHSLLPAEGDKVMLREVVANLLGNAVKYTKEKDLAIIEVGCREQLDQIEYYVKDNGIGFNIKYLEKVFLPFNRLHQSTQFEGNGAGLAIVKRLVERHGGRVWAQAKEEEGATFYFSLPKEPLSHIQAA